MNRLQKSCFLVSAALHGLLVLILFIGPAFLGSDSSKQDNITLIDFVPVKTVDSAMSGGGNPRGALPPPPAPQQPAPQPAAPVTPPAPTPEPVKPAPQPEPVKPEPSVEVSKSSKPKVEVSLKPVKRSQVVDTRARDEARAREAADAQRAEAAAAIRRAAQGIAGGVAGSTEVGELKGPGGGGVPYANWKQAVKSVYDRAWVLPSGVTSDSGSALVSVTIGRDGRVLSAEIIRRSGNAAVDDSVQTTIDRVRYAAPLPEDSPDQQRTIQIYFDVKAKLLG
ncbi:MAG: TonB family protein [Verrucomicrobiota bacterium]